MNQVILTPNSDYSSLQEERVAIVRTTDRAVFKECRRRWDWSSHLRQNLQSKILATPLWMGTMMHFALEDFYGQKKYRTAANAVDAYCYAYLQWQKRSRAAIPDDWTESAIMCKAMLDYYENFFAPKRDAYPTLIYKDVLQTEVNVKIEVPWETLYQVAAADRVERIKTQYDKIYYSLQFDRVAIDQYNQLWIVEYKSAKTISASHFLTDPQITAYLAAAHIVYGEEFDIGGVLYQQHRKDIPKGPRILKAGTVSVAQNQVTSHALYRKALLDTYGAIENVPDGNIDFLNSLAEKETEFEDTYVRRDLITRNIQSLNSFFELAAMEIVDMLDPQLLIYPNLTRACAAMCSFWGPCINKDDGEDYEWSLAQDFEQRPTSYDNWRKYLPNAKDFTWSVPDISNKFSIINEDL